MEKTVRRTMTIGDTVHFEIVVGANEPDPISQQIRDQTYTLPSSFRLLFSLLRPGHRVLDLGAHIGTFSLAAAALGCQVIAVEASSYNAALLQASVAHNQFEHIKVVSAAVSDRPGTLQFVQAGPYGIVANPNVEAPSLPVPAVTVDMLLDDLGWDRVNLIKMDVEGSEVAAIRGMLHLLSRDDAPPIFYESNGHTLDLFGQTPNHLLGALEEFGYHNYLSEPGRLTPVSAGSLQAECNVDYLAIKQPFDPPDGWRVQQAMSLKETISRVVAACVHPLKNHRVYTAQTLAKADNEILAHPRARWAVHSLRTDPCPEVRTAVSWAGPATILDRTLGRVMVAAYRNLEGVRRRARQ